MSSRCNTPSVSHRCTARSAEMLNITGVDCTAPKPALDWLWVEGALPHCPHAKAKFLYLPYFQRRERSTPLPTWSSFPSPWLSNMWLRRAATWTRSWRHSDGRGCLLARYSENILVTNYSLRPGILSCPLVWIPGFRESCQAPRCRACWPRRSSTRRTRRWWRARSWCWSCRPSWNDTSGNGSWSAKNELRQRHARRNATSTALQHRAPYLVSMYYIHGWCIYGPFGR